MSRICWILVTTSMLSLAPPVLALAAPPAAAPGSTIAVQPITTVEGGVNSWVSVGVEQWSGHNTYQIGFPVGYVGGQAAGYFPFSELEFPLDVTMATLRVSADFSNRIPVNFSLKKPMSDPDDRLIDRDWVTVSDPGQLDIYSESQITSFNATLFDVDAGYKVLARPQGWLSVGFGYLYQNFDYEARLIRQWSPSGLAGYDYSGAGELALKYEVSYKVPFLQLRAEFRPVPQAVVQARLAYSPYVDGEDHDQHLLRYKDNKGDLDGDFWGVTLAGRYNFDPHWFVTAGLEYNKFDLEGTMTAEFYGVYDHTVKERLESEQTMLFLSAGYAFGAGAN